MSADFGREITTTVLWLNRFDGMDVRCVRLVPYDIDGKLLLDIQQTLPLPEAADYQVRLRRKDAARDRARTGGRDLTRYHIVVDGNEFPDQNKRNAIRIMVQQLAERGAPLAEIYNIIPKRMKVLVGCLPDPDSVRQAMVRDDPKIDPRRWFYDHPLIDDGAERTYVLSNQWGRKTESRLEALANAFPQAKVTFHRAASSEE